MILLRYAGENTCYTIKFNKLGKSIIQIMGDFPVKAKGFVLYREETPEDLWNYLDYKTVYRDLDGGVQFSCDGSVYVAPPKLEPVPEPEPYIPTLEEIKEAKKQEIRLAYNSVKAVGVDIELSTGNEHFPLSEEDITFLIGKQFELSTTKSNVVSYQDTNNRCKFYPIEDMQKIIQEALQYVSYQTTYRNTLWEWVDECQTKEEVEGIIYGCEVPEQYQNDVIRSYLAQVKEVENEST